MRVIREREDEMKSENERIESDKRRIRMRE